MAPMDCKSDASNESAFTSWKEPFSAEFANLTGATRTWVPRRNTQLVRSLDVTRIALVDGVGIDFSNGRAAPPPRRSFNEPIDDQDLEAILYT
mmetsp:Transcript_4159/g.6503  ORF Transcript_4159/g.6503 Transcript_4159/m.6503 type:complete len:93 (-) Transcript_4159:250-528(-)